MGKWTEEEMTCPECAAQGIRWVAKNPNGLRGHRQFKHGVLPSSSGQLPLQRQDLLISESKLEQLLDERFGVISEQVNELAGELEQLAEAAKGDGAAITELQERLSAAERKSIEDYSSREKAEFIIPWMQGLEAEDFVRLALETGHEAQLVEVNDPAVVAVLAQSFNRSAEPKIITGKTDRPGYKYLENLDLSVREK